MEHIDASVEHSTPIWAVFGDLMSGLLGAFVLILVGVLGVQLELVTSLEAEIQKRQQEEQRRLALEEALAGPLASGRITLDNGKIGISGNVLFALNSDQLQPEGRQVLKGLAQPIADNWELSAQRALTVTRTLIEEGVPADAVFAAAFGSQQPVAANSDAEGRARNRRVEMAPVPKSGQPEKEANG
ncbi:MAG: OmpA family protein [Azonexus sp.]|jgi:flagellar motor protein MotB|nr:OmpA family protein [Azonexus sp.]